MGHMLSTMNPEEASKLQGHEAVEAVADAMRSGESIDPIDQPFIDTSGMPEIGDWVLYQPRRGEIRRGRNRVAALVTWVYPDSRLCDLAIFYEANDTVDQQRIPEAVGEERGWIVKTRAAAPSGEIAELRKEIVELRQIMLGDYEAPLTSLFAMLDDLDGRIDKLGGKPAPKAKKRK